MSTAKESKSLPRFVWAIGSYAESFPDMPSDLGVVLWDRQERKPVVTLHDEYAQLICLETAENGPFSELENWTNKLSDVELESEGLAPTREAHRV